MKLPRICLLFLLASVSLASAGTPRGFVLPKGPPLSGKLIVCDVSDAPLDEVLYYVSIQGIVNQRSPCVYLVIDKEYDKVWLDWILERGYASGAETVSRNELLRRCRSEVRGAVVYDPALPATVNIATMIAAIHKFAIVSPRLAQESKLPTKADLRGRFRDNAEAYSWAIEHLMPHLNKHALCSLYPYAAQHRVRDYCIQQKLFTFWVIGPEDKEQAGASKREREEIERAFRATKTNSPVIGFWYAGDEAPGISEYEGLKWAGSFGKPTVCHDWATNTSIHSAMKVAPAIFRQKPGMKSTFQRDKIYVAVSVTESGDAPWYWQRRQRTVWEDPNRGKVPISWCIGAATLDIHPAILEWYYRHASQNDYFFAAMSGAAYMIPEYYATRTSDPEAVWSEFLQLTDQYMRQLDLSAITLHMDIWSAQTQYEESQIFKRYAEGIPSLRVILADFGRMEDLDISRTAHKTSKDVVVFHCLNRWDIVGDAGEWLAEQIKQYTPPERPGFMHVMALSWTFKPSDILKARELLGNNYEFVTVGELERLWRYSRR